MSKDAQTRLTDTLNYIKTLKEIPANLITTLESAKGKDLAVSGRISLGAHINHSTGETSRRHAGRALLLCMDWYGGQTKIAQAKTHFRNANEATIKDAIQSFFPIQGKNAQSVVEMAKKIKPNAGKTIGMENFYQCHRDAIIKGTIKLGTACYESVNLWLYLAGITSLRWLKDNGAQPGHKLPDQWNWGKETTSIEDAKKIPAGQFIRFRRGVAGLHYTVSTGNGKCIGNHNSQDVCVNWLKDYGTAPMPHTSEFSIAGYLATMQHLNKDPSPNSTPVLCKAGIVPKAPY